MLTACAVVTYLSGACLAGRSISREHREESGGIFGLLCGFALVVLGAGSCIRLAREWW